MTPVIKFGEEENFWIIDIYFGPLTLDLKKIEPEIKKTLIQIAENNDYSEIKIINLDYSIENFVMVHYSFTKA